MPGPGVFPGMGGGRRFPGVGDAAPYVGGCPLTGSRANLRRGAGTPPYGCNSRKRCRGRACPARRFPREWAVMGDFRGVGDAAPYVGGCPLTGGYANLRRGVGTPPYGCNSRKRCRGGIYAAREFIWDTVRRLLFFFQHWAGHTIENVSSLPGMDV